jgi:hypothetical protein
LAEIVKQKISVTRTVKTQGFGKDKNKNHTDKQLFLLTNGPDTGITDNTDSHTSGQTG